MEGRGRISEITDERSFEEALSSANRDHRLLVVEYSAPWCGHCRRVGPGYHSLSEKYPDVRFVNVNVDEAQDVAINSGVSATPTFVVVKDGKQLNTLVGEKLEDLERDIRQYA